MSKEKPNTSIFDASFADLGPTFKFDPEASLSLKTSLLNLPKIIIGPGDASNPYESLKEYYFRAFENEKSAGSENQPSSTRNAEVERWLTPGDFPINSFPSVMKDVAENIAEVHSMGCDVPAMTALATLSGAIGKSVVVDSAFKEEKTHCNIYVLAGAGSGSGKGLVRDLVAPLLNASSDLLDAFNEEKVRLQVQIDASTAQKKAVIKGIKETQPSEKQLKEMEDIQRAHDKAKAALDGAPSYDVGATTPQALEIALEKNNDQIFSYSPDAGEIIRGVIGKSAKGMDLLVSGYSVEKMKSSTKRDGSVNIIPCITALWMVQPSLLRSFYESETVFERGLSARVLPLHIAATDIPLSDEVDLKKDKKVFESWENCIRGALQNRETRRELKPTSESIQVFNAWHDEAAKFHKGNLDEALGFDKIFRRCRENAIRIAGILAVAENSGEITEGIAESAVAIARWSFSHALLLLIETKRDDAEKRLATLRNLLAKSDEPFLTAGHLKKNNGFKKDELDHLAFLFPTDLRIEEVSNLTGKGGRISHRVYLSPEI